MNVLVDHNLRGHSVVLAGSLAASGWLEVVYIRFVLFEEIGLEVNSSDRVVWQCAQANGIGKSKQLQPYLQRNGITIRLERTD